MKYISLILVFIAGIAKAIMDTLQFHFSNSLFNGLNQDFWNAAISWQNQHNTWIPSLFTDGWHLFQSLFLTSMFAAIVLYQRITKYLIVDFLLLRLVFGIGFVLFYDYILIK